MNTKTAININAGISCGVVLSGSGDDMRMLLLKRTDTDYWCHVGGRIEREETAWQAILRELDEETGLKPDNLYSADYILRFYDIASNSMVMTPAFLCYYDTEPAITLNREHSDYRWCTLEEACGCVEFPNLQEMYRHIWHYFSQQRPSDYLRVKL